MDYLADPIAIEAESFRRIRQALSEMGIDESCSRTTEEWQIVLRVVHSLGWAHLAQHLCFSEGATAAGLEALKNKATILCDVEMVRHGLTQRYCESETLCFLRDVPLQTEGEKVKTSRTMRAVDHWYEHLLGSIVLIGNAPTALFRLLEILQAGGPKPALVIAMPVGFVGATESKQALWQQYQELNLECITLLGPLGGSAVTAAACNALLRCLRGIYV